MKYQIITWLLKMVGNDMIMVLEKKTNVLLVIVNNQMNH